MLSGVYLLYAPAQEGPRRRAAAQRRRLRAGLLRRGALLRAQRLRPRHLPHAAHHGRGQRPRGDRTAPEPASGPQRPSRGSPDEERGGDAEAEAKRAVHDVSPAAHQADQEGLGRGGRQGAAMQPQRPSAPRCPVPCPSRPRAAESLLPGVRVFAVVRLPVQRRGGHPGPPRGLHRLPGPALPGAAPRRRAVARLADAEGVL
mmetsp:Transcript_8849/g.33419  ORF Transcript_8849/g.33419 Transcript_8849/m.33419 type:complete len:202 (+) Transcript_8849:346-951(+)|eukprot:scaffold452_cov235-Pinguiococcus_pyrenoidosus.AAC.4